MLVENKKGEYNLVEKIQAERTINKEALRSTLLKLWKTTKLFTIFDISPNIFIIKYECQTSKQRVMQCRSWLFDSFFFVLELFDGCIPFHLSR